MLQLFRYGPEAIKHLQENTLREPLTTLVLPRLDKGSVSAMLPEYTDPADLLKFRTDIFWGKPPRGREIMEHITGFCREFLMRNPRSLLIAESGDDRERHLLLATPFYLYRSSLCSEAYTARGLYLTAEQANDGVIRTFFREGLSYCRAAFLCALPAGREPSELIQNDKLASPSVLEELANHTAHLISPAYDLTAYLIWTAAQI